MSANSAQSFFSGEKSRKIGMSSEKGQIPAIFLSFNEKKKGSTKSGRREKSKEIGIVSIIYKSNDCAIWRKKLQKHIKAFSIFTVPSKPMKILMQFYNEGFPHFNIRTLSFDKKY